MKAGDSLQEQPSEVQWVREARVGHEAGVMDGQGLTGRSLMPCGRAWTVPWGKHEGF